MYPFFSEPQLPWKEQSVVFPRPCLGENPPNPHRSAASISGVRWSELPVKGLQHSLKRLFPGPYPEVSLKALMISHCFHGDSERADHQVLTRTWAGAARCWPEQAPDALLSLSLIIADGALPPSIKLDWISIKKSNSFLGLSEALPEVSSKCNLLHTREFPFDTCGS